MANFTVGVAAGGDDYWHRLSTNGFNNSSTYLTCTGDVTNYHWATQFDGVTIPPGSTISASVIAYVVVEADPPAVTFKIALVDEDNAAAATDDASCDTDDAIRTTAQVDWDFDGGAIGSALNSADFTAPTQEVIDRVGWASGNSLLVHVFGDGGTGEVNVASYDNATYTEPTISITYTPPVTVVTGAAALTSTSTTTAAGLHIAVAAAALSITATLTAAPFLISYGAAALSITATLTAAPFLISYGAAALSTTATLTTTGVLVSTIAATVTVEFAPGDNWNTTPTWVDITDKVFTEQPILISRGRQSRLQTITASTLTLTLDNQTRAFDPDNTAGAYTGDLVPLTQIRVSATQSGVTTVRFRGHVVEWAVSGYQRETVTVTALDALTVLALLRLPSRWRAEVEADTPRAWWRLGETIGATAVDSSGNGWHGTYVGTPTLGASNTAILGDPDSAVTFDGVNDYVSLPSGAAPDGSGPWTIEFWFRTTASAARNNLVNLGTAGTLTSDVQLWTDTNGKLNVAANSAGGATATLSIVSAAAFNDGVNYLVMLNHNGAGTIEAFVDAVSIGTDSL